MSAPAGYSGTPLPAKLGIRDGSAVLVDGGPPDLPVASTGRAPYDVVLLFAPDRARLVRRWPALVGRLTPAGRLWVCWPKRASGLQTDLDENGVREHGLAQGLVDVKVCAVDATWSGLAFVTRLRDR